MNGPETPKSELGSALSHLAQVLSDLFCDLFQNVRLREIDWVGRRKGFPNMTNLEPEQST